MSGPEGGLGGYWPKLFANVRNDCQVLGKKEYSPARGIERWRFPLGDVLPSPPVVGPPNDTVYLTTYYLVGLGYLLAVNYDGTERWRLPLAGMVSNLSPAVGADGTIYVVAYSHSSEAPFSQRLLAIKEDGHIKWDRLIVERLRRTVNLLGPPSIASDGTIYVQCGSTLYAYSPGGNEKWTTDLSGPTIVTSVSPSWRRIVLAFFTFGISEIFFEGFTYDDTFRGPPPKYRIMSGPVPAIGPDETIYANGDFIAAVNPDGTIKWSDGYGKPWSNLSVDEKGDVLAASGQELYLFSASDGKVLWRYNAGETIVTSAALGPRLGVPSEQVAVVGDEAGYIRVVRLQDGKLEWKQSVRATVSPLHKETPLSPPAVDYGGRLYIPSAHRLFAPRRGLLRVSPPWEYLTRGNWVSQPAIAGSKLYFVSSNFQRVGVTDSILHSVS